MKKTQGPDYQKLMTRRVSDQTLIAAESLLKGIDSSGCRKVLSLIKTRRWQELVDLDMSDIDVSGSAAQFRDDYLSFEMLSKFPGFDLGIDRVQAALTSFDAAEQECAVTNARLRADKARCWGLLSPYTPAAAIVAARDKIARVLGPFSWDEAFEKFQFGSGATCTQPRRRSDAYYKYGSKPSVTRKAAVLAHTSISLVPRWLEHVVSLTGLSKDDFESLAIDKQIEVMFEIVPGNRLQTVPKNAKTERMIALEPTMNGYIQSGIAAVMTRKLKRVGVDLHDQTWNQELARLGAINGSVSTVDLKSASDSVSLELVRALYPPDWVEAFELCRSEVGVLPDGRVITYQKVSSMGNSFNFPVETMIFWALGQVACEWTRCNSNLTATYGDDIVVPTGATHTLLWLLDYFGFTPNVKKTHWKGEFRESCGKHYFRGLDVSPFYFREEVDSVPRLYWLANQIHRWARLSWGLDGRLEDAYTATVSKIPRPCRFPVPDSFGDLGLISSGVIGSVKRCFGQHDAFQVKFCLPRILPRQYGGVPTLLKVLGYRKVAEAPWMSKLNPQMRVQLGMCAYPGEAATQLSFVSTRSEVSWSVRRLKTGGPQQWPDYGEWLS